MAKKSTRQVGVYTVQEHNMVVPDGKKVWLVKDANGKTVHSSQSKTDAIEWAKEASGRY